MKIYSPEIIERENDIVIHARFHLEKSEENKSWYSLQKSGSYLWYSVDKKWADYLTIQNGDAFLIALLPLAVRFGENIEIEPLISDRLYYNLSRYYLDFLSGVKNDPKPVQIYHNGLYKNGDYISERATGLGFSGGVDSFLTLFQHVQENVPDRYRPSYLFFLNVGAHDDWNSENARRLFLLRFEKMKKIAAEVSLEMIRVDSNLSDVIQNNYPKDHTIRNVSAILNFQRLLGQYYYSSGVTYHEFWLNPNDCAYYDLMTLNYLSTDNLQFYPAGIQYKRTEKTELLTQYPISYKYLNVCLVEENNCSKCDKCCKTLLTLEILGKIPLYGGVFDLQKWEQVKQKYLAYVFLKKNNIFNQELINLMREHNFQMIPGFWKIYLKERILVWMKQSKVFLSEIFANLPKKNHTLEFISGRIELK